MRELVLKDEIWSALELEILNSSLGSARWWGRVNLAVKLSIYQRGRMGKEGNVLCCFAC